METGSKENNSRFEKEVMSFGRREIFTHIEYSPSFYNKEKVSVNYMIAEKCSLSESIKNIDIGIYLKVYYHGSIDDIIGISKLAYTQFLLKVISFVAQVVILNTLELIVMVVFCTVIISLYL